MLFDHSNYRDFLREVLTERIQQNRQYSLRGFARNIGIQPSLLSEVLGGRRKLSVESANLVAQELGLTGQEQDYFELLVELDRAKNPARRESTLRKIQQINPNKKNIHDLSVDHFVVISEWYHFAILRLTEVEGFQWSIKNVARALGIHEVEVSLALERLERLQLIETVKGKKPVKTGDNYLVHSSVPNEAIRKYHQQMLQKTTEALSSQGPKERFSGTEDLLLAEDQMKEASEIFEECFTKILALSKKPSQKQKQVYHVGIHAIQLSKVTDQKTVERKK
jgi:uncharacterized protein (TIGR02147 family)